MFAMEYIFVASRRLKFVGMTGAALALIPLLTPATSSALEVSASLPIVPSVTNGVTSVLPSGGQSPIVNPGQPTPTTSQSPTSGKQLQTAQPTSQTKPAEVALPTSVNSTANSAVVAVAASDAPRAHITTAVVKTAKTTQAAVRPTQSTQPYGFAYPDHTLSAAQTKHYLHRARLAVFLGVGLLAVSMLLYATHWGKRLLRAATKTSKGGARAA